MSKVFVMTENAIENYGEKWRGVELIPTHRATKYMPSKEFFAKGQPKGYHPGYDKSAGCALYDLARKDTGDSLPMSLYEWELQQV